MRRRPLEHAAAMGALLITFLAVTAGIGTVAASEAPTPRSTPHVRPSAGEPGPAAAATTGRPAAAGLSPTGPRPGQAPHVSPGAPLTYAFLLPEGEPGLPRLHSPQAAIVVDIDTHAVLWSTWAHERRATASLAKIFTVMVAMDHTTDSDQEVTVPPGGEDDNPDHTVVGLKVGDTLRIRELVDGVWLASGDDAAETLARIFVPRDQFLAEMNAKAAFLGLRDTHFTNPSGLDDPGEYSSAYDLAVASGWLWLHYPRAFALARETYVPLVLRGQDYSLKTLNKMVTGMPGSTKPYPGANGLKTGYTDSAGGCVVATAERGGHRLVAVVMGDDWFFTDAGALLDRGFASEH